MEQPARTGIKRHPAASNGQDLFEGARESTYPKPAYHFQETPGEDDTGMQIIPRICLP